MEDDLDRIAAGDEERGAWLQRFYFGDDGDDDGPEGARLRPRRHRRARDQHDRDRRRHRAARRPLRPLHRARTASASTISDEIAPDELTVERRRGAARAGPPSSASSASTPRPAATIAVKNGRYGPYVTEVAEGRREAAHGLALQVDVAGDGHARGRAPLLSLPRTRRHRPRTARRSSPRTAATGRT